MSLDRRQFLASTALLAAMPASIRHALAADPAVDTGTIKDLGHIVILMQENRGFDHYFGTMRGVRGYGDRFPVPLENGKDVWFQANGEREVPPFHMDPARFNALLAPSTPHGFADSQAAWNQGKFGQWPKYKNDNAMGYFRRDDIPFQFALAEAFTLCDAYHCSITTGTDPNRITFFSGSNFNPSLARQGINCTDADSEPNNLRCWIANPDVDKWPDPGYTYQGSAFDWPTLPELLEAAGISWRIYQDPNDNWTGAMHGGLAFANFRNAKPGSALYENGMSHWGLDTFAAHVREGTLPQVSWVLPPREFSEHPGGPSSPQKGGWFTEQVLEALTANPEVWSRSALFITFDENDGLFDHVPPPAPPSYDSEGRMAGKATLPLDGEYFSDPERKYLVVEDTISGTVRPFGLSARVPMYVVSPWSRGGWVTSQVCDHTSLAMFLEKRFDLNVPNVSPWHRAVCGDLTTAFDFAGGNASLPMLPTMQDYAALDEAQRAMPRYMVPGTPEPLFQEQGMRPSRALPYELHVEAALDQGNALVLEFRNTGTQGAVFHVYDRLHLDRIPRRFTVEAGKQLQDNWMLADDAGAYDLWVYGPNGFVRVFRDEAATDSAGLESSVEYDRARASLNLTLHNSGTRAVTIRIRDEAYGLGGPWELEVAAGGSAMQPLALEASARWYDLSMTPVTGGTWLRRIAGRLENGEHGVSDPAFGTA